MIKKIHPIRPNFSCRDDHLIRILSRCHGNCSDFCLTGQHTEILEPKRTFKALKDNGSLVSLILYVTLLKYYYYNFKGDASI